MKLDIIRDLDAARAPQDGKSILETVYNTVVASLSTVSAGSQQVADLLERAVTLLKNITEADYLVKSARDKLLTKNWVAIEDVFLGLQSGDIVDLFPPTFNFLNSKRAELYPKRAHLILLKEDDFKIIIKFFGVSGQAESVYVYGGTKIKFIGHKDLPKEENL